MSGVLELAVTLNGGRRVDALGNLAEILGVNAQTIRRWHRDGQMPKAERLAAETLIENRILKAKISRIAAVVEE